VVVMGPAPICMFCRHFRRDEIGLYCEAFPEGDGIPEGILESQIDHRLPVKGDRGIQFEQDGKRPTLDEERYDALFASGLPATSKEVD